MLIAHKRELASLLASPVLSKEFLNLTSIKTLHILLGSCERWIASAGDPKWSPASCLKLMIICHNTIFATLQKKEKRRRRFDNNNNNNNVSSLISPQKQSGRVSYIVYNPLLPLCNSHS